MSRKNPNGLANLSFFEPALEGFCSEYKIELQIFGDERLHWRLTGMSATLDCWPTTGKYWIKDLPLNGFMTTHERTGWLPYDYNRLDVFLRELFGIDN